LTVETNIDPVLGSARRLPPEIESTVYRLVQEALTNAVKHAEADRLKIDMLTANGSVEVAVSDDGRGFDPAGDSRGFGLTGIRERVALVGGELRIDSAHGAGTTLRASIPIS
jgi:signal transduction histidine kinase